jgi:hypothetical protein
MASKDKLMRPSTFPRIHGARKPVSALIGAGAIVAMVAIPLAGTANRAGTNSDSWQADYDVTLVPATRSQPSAKPQYLIDLCDWATNHMQLHHNC